MDVILTFLIVHFQFFFKFFEKYIFDIFITKNHSMDITIRCAIKIIQTPISFSVSHPDSDSDSRIHREDKIIPITAVSQIVTIHPRKNTVVHEN
jgi:hypothetical protein